MPAVFCRAIEQGNVLVAALDGNACGFALLTPDDAEISAIFVAPAAQRRGVGARLLSQLEARARALGFSRLRLTSTLNAEPFYTASGYRALERKPWRHPAGFELPSVLMEKDLNPKPVM